MSRTKKPPHQPTQASYVFENLDEIRPAHMASGQGLKLFLPFVVHSNLVEEKKAADLAFRNERSRELTEQRLRKIEADERRAQQQAPAYGPFDVQRQSAVEKRQALIEQEQTAIANPRRWRQIYEVKAVDHMIDTARRMAVDKDLRKRDEELGRRLSEAGAYRKIAVPPALEPLPHCGTVNKRKKRKSSAPVVMPVRAINQAFEGLRSAHPHFTEVIDFVCQQLVLASESSKPMSLPPILLDGEPGVGKTHFSFDLAEVLGTSYERVAFDTPVTASSLLGSDRRWANTEFGLLFKLVCLGPHANPVIVLDEIDKAVFQRNSNPLDPLHTLLEPNTAVKLRDLSMNFEFDASMVTWIATSNHSRFLPSAILSRFTRFEICRPDAAGALASAKAVLQKAFSAMGLVNFEPPGRDMVAALAHFTPREVIQTYKQAVATALTKGKRCAGVDDLPAGVHEQTLSPGETRPAAWLH